MQEPSRDFRQAVRLEMAQIMYGKITVTTIEEATDRIISICKEMLVPEEAIDSDDGNQAMMSAWNACRQHILKQLGEK